MHTRTYKHTQNLQESHTARCEDNSNVPKGVWFGAAAAATAVGTALAIAARKAMIDEQEKIGVWRDRYEHVCLICIFIRDRCGRVHLHVSCLYIGIRLRVYQYAYMIGTSMRVCMYAYIIMHVFDLR
jgi:hypothetical protein